MKRRPLTLLLSAALLVQTFALGASAADDTYYEDPLYWEESQQGDGLYEEETLTFDSFTPRELDEVEILRCGVDVSSWQADIDWEKVAEDGVEFAFIRVGYRGITAGSLNEDKYYVKNIEGALAQGIQVGVYIYSQAITPEEAVEEAEYILERVDGYELSLPVVFDYEYGYINGKPGRLASANLTKDEATAICDAFCHAVEAQGYQSAVYANKSFLNNQLHAKKLDSVWLAHYIMETDYTGDYDFWQCTSSGRVSGVSGYTDLNFWFDDGTFQTVLPFRDVARNYWGYDGIRYAYENGIVIGVNDKSFAPKDNATRGQVATMLYRMMGEPEVTWESTFTDLHFKYYRNAIAWAQREGVIKGRTETTFDPEANVTRQELVAMIYRLAGEPETNFDLSAYEDANKISKFAQKAMAWAVENGIIKGETKTILNPVGNASREEIATILMRFDKLQ